MLTLLSIFFYMNYFFICKWLGASCEAPVGVMRHCTGPEIPEQSKNTQHPHFWEPDSLPAYDLRSHPTHGNTHPSCMQTEEQIYHCLLMHRNQWVCISFPLGESPVNCWLQRDELRLVCSQRPPEFPSQRWWFRFVSSFSFWKLLLFLN